MERVQIYIDNKQLKKLRDLKKKTGAPISEIIRRCIEKYLKTLK